MASFRISNTHKLIFLVFVIIVLKLAAMLNKPANLISGSHTVRNLTEKEFLDMGFDSSQNFDIDENAEVNKKVTEEMKIIIDRLRDQIRQETKGYKLPSNREVESLIPERGGTPMRSVVITTWRSGSTFIGGVLDSHPATFHFSEPLTDFRTVQVRGEPLGTLAVRALRSLLTCNYRVLGRYLERSKEYTWLSTHNTRLWAHCENHKDICYEPEFLTPVCRLFPFQSMKVVHIRLRLVEELLADPNLNVRVLYLMRDPRGVMSSRASLGWCRKSPDCGSPTHVCADLVDDYAAALRFDKLFPGKFKVVRYEDMSLRPHEVMPEIFSFFGLQYHRDVQDFVKVHTTQNNKNKYSTFRNSSAQALLWRTKLDYRKVRQLQTTCRLAMAAWGYLPAHNASHQAVFNPLVQPFSLT
ncbi:carbohydrate sulfotransferase 1-like [Macrosteles quadrilineatus]|uniref:carbohydrate sulfotransferase 1-like n=1 Tax=Macrosteles quadrilineatus TaxID=74068 RepID=UPI0023E17687|nr:carbohydrate sulfotransferase 1-like [Macrosteles quadrilineatus]